MAISPESEPSMMRTLLSLPLFQGLARQEFIELIEKTRLEFLHVADASILRQGDHHTQVVYVLSGQLVRTVQHGVLTFSETLSVPALLEPYSLFGRDDTLHASYSVNGPADLLVIDKRYLYTVFNRYAVVQINILNLLSASAQHLSRKLLPAAGTRIEDRLLHLVDDLSEQEGSERRLAVNRVQLATLLGVSRRAMSEVIADMQRRGLLRIEYGALVFLPADGAESVIIQNPDNQ